MRSAIPLVALAAAAQAQDAATTVTTASPTSVFVIETTIPENPPDALDLEGINAIPDPTYTSHPGLYSEVVSYPTIAAATSSVAAAVSSDPLSVFPAATTVAMNALGESDAQPTGTPKRRRDTRDTRDAHPIVARGDCDPEATIPNFYNVNVTSYAAFKSDPTIASVALGAVTPSGYYAAFTNSLGANSAMAYMGYEMVTTYNTTYCAAQCNAKSGCLSFNIYFERDPTVTPADNTCPNPPAFANIKCSYWGVGLDLTTANNYGQWRSQFQVGIAGSNAYTNNVVGPPIAGCDGPLKLNNAVMNAPLRDCQGTWTYMGYKLFTNLPYNPLLCKTACDTQSAYDKAHPPTDNTNTAICTGFGSYVLTKMNSSGVFPQGQMCTMYTAGWGKQYAVNTASYDATSNYTYTYSFFYNITSGTASQPVCPTSTECSKPFNCSSGATGDVQACPSNNQVYCFPNLQGGGNWAIGSAASNTTACSASNVKCTKDSQCGAGAFCSPTTCCGSICKNHLNCANTSKRSNLFDMRATIEREEKRDEEKRAVKCIPTDFATCPDEE